MNKMSLLFFNILVLFPVFHSVKAAADESFQFSLPSISGSTVDLSPSNEFSITVVCFLGNECPMARHYARKLTQMNNILAARGVRFIGINSNQQDSMEELRQFASELNVSFELAKDYDNSVADKYQAIRTPEVYVLNKNLEVCYRGRIDDQYSPGVVRPLATKFFVKQAIDDLLDGKPVFQENTKAVGCLIGRNKTPIANPTVTYTKHIAHLIQKHCIECHRTDEIGPFALDNYDEVRGWAEMMNEVVQDGRMPPWHATDRHRQLINSRHLTKLEKQQFADWLEQGMPYGDSRELPEQRKFVTGWRLPRQPDYEIKMREQPYQVAATGTVEYQYFVVDPGFTEDTWISAAEVIPGNRSVVHHSIVFVRPPDDSPGFRGIGWLAAYVPGQGKPVYKETHARLIPARSKIVFQQHYTPTGKPESDLTKIGLVLADPEKITHEVYTLAGINQEFEIPAGSKNHLVRTRLPRFPEHGELLSVGPHMHYRGKSFDLFFTSNNQNRQLIEVPAYDFNWQHNYQFETPLPLRNIDLLSMEFRFDNSDGNPFNPNSNERITWGDQTWEEMAVAFFEIAEPITAGETAKTDSSQLQESGRSTTQAKRFAADYFDRFDRNNDGVLIRDELPRAIRRFKFHKYDVDGDGKLTVSELQEKVQQRFNDD